MSWQEIMRRVLPPIGSVSPHVTSEYGSTDRPKGSSNPHGGVDFNYFGGKNARLNLSHQALRSPISSIVTNAGEGTDGRIAIRDENGFTHEILHSYTRHVAVGDPVVAGQLIGTMGNTGVNKREPEKGPHHVHYQLKDPAGNVVNPTAFWDQQEPIDPNPAPPAYLGEYQQYLRGLGANRFAGAGAVGQDGRSLPNSQPIGSSASGPFGTGGKFVPGSATSSRPLYETRSFVAPSDGAADADAGKEVRRLVRLPAGKTDFGGLDPDAPAALPNEIPPVDRTTSFDDRFGNWNLPSGVSGPLAPSLPLRIAVAATGRPLGLFTGKPLPDYPVPPPLGGLPGNSLTPGLEDWAEYKLASPRWSKKVR